MKPRIVPERNERIDPKTVTAPNTHDGDESYTHEAPFIVTGRRIMENQGIPGVVSCPKKY